LGQIRIGKIPIPVLNFLNLRKAIAENNVIGKIYLDGI
jgi:hypothetical protein